MINNKKAFTLIEMSIFLAIFALIISTSMSLFKTTYDKNRTLITKKEQQKIKSSLIGYAAIHGRLPSSDTTGDGKGEGLGGLADIPHTDINIYPKDKFGMIYQYDANDALISSDDQNICSILASIEDSNTSLPLVEFEDNTTKYSVAAIVISKGKDKILTGRNENDGDTATSDRIYEMRKNLYNEEINNDLVVELTANELYGRLCSTGMGGDGNGSGGDWEEGVSCDTYTIISGLDDLYYNHEESSSWWGTTHDCDTLGIDPSGTDLYGNDPVTISATNNENELFYKECDGQNALQVTRENAYDADINKNCIVLIEHNADGANVDVVDDDGSGTPPALDYLTVTAVGPCVTYYQGGTDPEHKVDLPDGSTVNIYEDQTILFDNNDNSTYNTPLTYDEAVNIDTNGNSDLNIFIKNKSCNAGDGRDLIKYDDNSATPSMQIQADGDVDYSTSSGGATDTLRDGDTLPIVTGESYFFYSRNGNNDVEVTYNDVTTEDSNGDGTVLIERQNGRGAAPVLADN
ncbi:MAG: type II secretion system protein [Campylobacterota bacterium]|nr:type II secretion system protein [Campylobacterota bacterium]